MINQQYRFCPMCHNTPQICQCNPTTALPDRLQARYAPPQNQPESEPVEWKVWTVHNHIFFSIGVQTFQINDVLEHEPEVSAEEFSEWLATQLRHALTQLSNTAPPKKEWVGLTDKEIDDLDYSGTRVEFARDIEAKLKEKNGY